MARLGKPDLEAWETALRGAVLACGASILSGVLTERGTGRREEEIVCRCGERSC